ncbi:uncharacterized protein G2W53_017446 [Senna tora]|uniref:Uncharacterized protein n=1 Tax=Senna tora TaxID=362788 RepID=A0A834WKI1_9FABA|nr:uncharacterized protein G2W53_017446 [Senna tora]
MFVEGTPSSQHTHRRNPVLPSNDVCRRTPSSEHTHHRSNTVVAAHPSSQQHRVSSLRFHVRENVWVVSLFLLDFSLISTEDEPKSHTPSQVIDDSKEWYDQEIDERDGRPGGRFKGGGITRSPSACGHIATPFAGFTYGSMDFDLYLEILLLNCSHMLLVSAQFLGNVLNACRDHTLGSSRSSQLHELSDIAFTFCIQL